MIEYIYDRPYHCPSGVCTLNENDCLMAPQSRCQNRQQIDQGKNLIRKFAFKKWLLKIKPKGKNWGASPGFVFRTSVVAVDWSPRLG